MNDWRDAAPSTNGDTHAGPVEAGIGVGLLDDLDRYLARFIAFPGPESRWAVALWAVHAHAAAAFESTPRLALLSPEKGSGKTRTLEVLALVVPHPIFAVNISAAALFRLVADQQPTLLLDEADTYLGSSSARMYEDLRGLINAGHRRGAKAYRGEVAGKSVKVVEFEAFAPCALAGIGDLPDTILDRAVVIGMKRRMPHEIVEPFRERLIRSTAVELHSRIARWAIGSTPALTDAWPDMPDGIHDRAADVWEPLIAIADHAGGHWPQRAREAAVALNTARAARDPSLGAQLLADIRRVLHARGTDRIRSEVLVDALVALDDAPWGDLRGKPVDTRGVARRLRRFEIRPTDHRFTDGTHKGYRLEDFYDAWARYLPPVADVAHVAHPNPQREPTDLFEMMSDQVGELQTSLYPSPSLSSRDEGQHGQQGQHPRSEHMDPEP